MARLTLILTTEVTDKKEAESLVTEIGLLVTKVLQEKAGVNTFATYTEDIPSFSSVGVLKSG